MARRKNGIDESMFKLVFVVAVFAVICFKVPSLRETYLSFFKFAGVGLVCLIALWLLKKFSSKIKGKVGERIVSSRLREGLPKGDYIVLDDLYLPIGADGTTQIDHVVVSRFGVFVVETKNYSGWIFASADSPMWTQTLYRNKNRFQNPMRQNYLHLCAISKNLGIPMEFLHGVVAFTGDCTFKTEMPQGVVYSRKAATFIKSFAKVELKEREVMEIVSALREWDSSVTPEQRKAHVANLKRRHGKGGRS